MKKIALIFSVLALIVGMSASFAPKVFAAGAPHGYTYFDAANPTGVTVTCSPLVGNGEGDYVRCMMAGNDNSADFILATQGDNMGHYMPTGDEMWGLDGFISNRT